MQVNVLLVTKHPKVIQKLYEGQRATVVLLMVVVVGGYWQPTHNARQRYKQLCTYIHTHINTQNTHSVTRNAPPPPSPPSSTPHLYNFALFYLSTKYNTNAIKKDKSKWQ